MSLSVDGVWKAGVWAQTVWADGVWREGAYNPPPEPEAQQLGGIPRKRKKYAGYPRRVVVKGQVYYVRNPEDERALLERLAEAFRDEAKTLEALGDTETAQEAKSAAVRVVNRIKAIDDRADEWKRKLLRDDEEVLMVIAG